jgi:hypothetical protein
MNLNEVVVVCHVYEDDDEIEQIKFIGVYSTEAKAKSAVELLLNQPGFQDYPDGFGIEVCQLDRTGWTEGFVKVPYGNQ